LIARFDARGYLGTVGALPDEDIDVAETALVLASIDEPARPLAPYREHLAQLADELKTRCAGGAESLAERIDALTGVLTAHGYRGDDETYDDLRNASLIHAIDRRRGLPVTLGILDLHLARAMGWAIVGLTFPGHFLVRLDEGAERAILDPFAPGRVCGVADLRAMLKAMEGDAAELEPAHYRPAGNRDTLLRLQNNYKLRHINTGAIDRALGQLALMRLFAPNEPSLWRETGLLEAHMGHTKAAIDALEEFMRLTDNVRHVRQTEMLIRRLKTRPH
jgi:regulator of sirC expression with transglutaminase-like and TPR domain